MACKVSPVFYAVLILGLIAVGLHTVGYTTHGWLVMSRKFTIEEIRLTSNMLIEQAIRMEDVDDSRQLIDNGGVVAPREDDRMMSDGRPADHDHDHDSMDHDHDHESRDGDRSDHRHPPPPVDPRHPGGRHPPRRPGQHHTMIEETTEVQEWLEESVVEIDHVYVKIMYGLWKSKLCVSTKMEHMDKEGDDMEDDDDSSSGRSSSDSGHKKKCHCKRLSTKCALAFSTMFMDQRDRMNIEPEGKQPWYKSNTKYFLGNTCLTEHRVESTVGLVVLVIAVIAGVMAFRKHDSCKCWSIVSLVGLIVAFVLISIPAHRVLRHNYHHPREHMSASRTHVPYSLIATLISALVTFILAIVVAVAMCRRKRMSKQWARFENEASESVSEKKGGMPPSLVFIPEPLSGKAGLYDVWGDVKPVEYVEPEKKPLE